MKPFAVARKVAFAVLPQGLLRPPARIGEVRQAAQIEVSEDELRRVVEARIEGRTLGLLGEPRVNVLLLNLELERD